VDASGKFGLTVDFRTQERRNRERGGCIERIREYLDCDG
jgi:hypothetical protein